MWADAEGRLQAERSQQTPSVYLWMSSENLALGFMGFLGHTGGSERTFGLWPRTLSLLPPNQLVFLLL